MREFVKTILEMVLFLLEKAVRSEHVLVMSTGENPKEALQEALVEVKAELQEL